MPSVIHVLCVFVTLCTGLDIQMGAFTRQRIEDNTTIRCLGGRGMPFFLLNENEVHFQMFANDSFRVALTSPQFGATALMPSITISSVSVDPAWDWGSLYAREISFSGVEYNDHQYTDRSNSYIGCIGEISPLIRSQSLSLPPNNAYTATEATYVTYTEQKGSQSVVYTKEVAPGKDAYATFYDGPFILWPGELFMPIIVESVPQNIQVATTVLPSIVPNQMLLINDQNRVFFLNESVELSYVDGSSILQIYFLGESGGRFAHYFVQQAGGRFISFVLNPPPKLTTFVQFILEKDELYGGGRALITVRPTTKNTTDIPWNGTIKSCVECTFKSPVFYGPLGASVSGKKSYFPDFPDVGCAFPRNPPQHRVLNSDNCTMQSVVALEGSPGYKTYGNGDAIFYMEKYEQGPPMGEEFYTIEFGGVVQLAIYQALNPCNIRVTVVDREPAAVGVQTPVGVRFLATGQSVRYCAPKDKDVGLNVLLIWNLFTSQPVRVMVERFEVSLHTFATVTVTDECFALNLDSENRLVLTPNNDGNPIVASYALWPSFIEGVAYSQTGKISLVAYRYRQAMLGYSIDWSLPYLSKEGFPGMLLKKYNVSAVFSRCSCHNQWTCGEGYSCMGYNEPEITDASHNQPITVVVDASEKFSRYQYRVYFTDSGLVQFEVSTDDPMGPGLLISGSAPTIGNAISYSPYVYINQSQGMLIRATSQQQTVTLCGKPGMTLYIQVYPRGLGSVTFKVNELLTAIPLLSPYPFARNTSALLQKYTTPVPNALYCRLPIMGYFESPSAYIQLWPRTDLSIGGPCSYVDTASGEVISREGCSLFKGCIWFIPEMWKNDVGSSDTPDETLVLNPPGMFISSSLRVDQRSRSDIYDVELVLFGLPDEKFGYAKYITISRIIVNSSVNFSEPAIVANFLGGSLITELSSPFIGWEEQGISNQSVFAYAFCLHSTPTGDECQANTLYGRAHFYTTGVVQPKAYPGAESHPTSSLWVIPVLCAMLIFVCCAALWVYKFYKHRLERLEFAPLNPNPRPALVREEDSTVPYVPVYVPAPIPAPVPVNNTISERPARGRGAGRGRAKRDRKPEVKEVTESFVMNTAFGSFSSPDAALCCICLDQPRNTMSMPCKHMFGCEECARKVSHCPLCRVKIIEYNVVRKPNIN